MRKTLPLVVVLLFVGARSPAQSAPVLAAAEFGAEPDPAIPAAPAQLGIGGNPLGGGGGLAPFGNGEQPVLRFAGDTGPLNQFTFSLADNSGYDDDILGTNAAKHGDFFTSVGPRVLFLTSRKRMSFNFDYAPTFQIYKRYSQLDGVNQTLNLDAAATLSPRLQLRARNITAETYYGLFSGSSDSVPGLTTPGGPVPFFVNPETRTITNTDRVDTIFSKSGRTSIDLYGSYFLLNVKNVTGGATGTYADLKGYNAGWSYRYQSSPRGSFSLTYAYGKSRYTGVSSGYANQTASLSYAYQISGTTSISVFGGPEYTYLNETLLIGVRTPAGIVEVPFGVHKPQWDWSAGLSATTSTKGTGIALSLSRFVGSAGGLLTAVNSTFGSLTISHRLPKSWTGRILLNYGQYEALSFGGVQSGKYTTGVGNVTLNRDLGEHLGLTLTYNYTTQSGSSPIIGTAVAPGFTYANLDRNRASVGISWQIAKVHLGH
ncbi:MAG TPA: hypothetical protein VKM93_16930 [Terriglobia bacterium]|nr:hypothetical protein [Terriglobia bacterium]